MPWARGRGRAGRTVALEGPQRELKVVEARGTEASLGGIGDLRETGGEPSRLETAFQPVRAEVERELLLEAGEGGGLDSQELLEAALEGLPEGVQYIVEIAEQWRERDQPLGDILRRRHPVQGGADPVFRRGFEGVEKAAENAGLLETLGIDRQECRLHRAKPIVEVDADRHALLLLEALFQPWKLFFEGCKVLGRACLPGVSSKGLESLRQRRPLGTCPWSGSLVGFPLPAFRCIKGCAEIIDALHVQLELSNTPHGLQEGSVGIAHRA